MVWRFACAVACVGVSIASGGCANPQLASGNTTSSLSNVVSALGVSLKPAAETRSHWEEAVIAQAIAAHEMRNP